MAFWWVGGVLACLVGLLMMPAQARAQAVTYSGNTWDSPVGGISGSAASCSNPFRRSLSIASAITVGDVNIGVLAAHARRSDLVMYLVSPSGTRVMLTASAGGTATNFNAQFDDEASAPIANYTANATAFATTQVPPFAGNYRPVAPLSAFDGENAQGNWTLEICDQTWASSGTFYQTSMFVTERPASYADLSLGVALNNNAPATGAEISYTYTVGNASATTSVASAVTVRAPLPSGVAYVSHSGTGSYDPVTGVWSVGSLAPGESASLTLSTTVVAAAGAVVTASAEVTAASGFDLDSTPGNGLATEDDYAAISFSTTAIRAAGTAPMLVCPAGTRLFDWDARSWAAGSLANTYALPGIGTIGFSVSNPGSFLNNSTLGGLSPALQTTVTGGLAGAQLSLAELVDLPTASATVSTTIDLGAIVPGAQFRLFDVDYGAGQFADRVTVTGYLGGVTVMPTMTNGVSNYVIGNTAYGDGISDVTSADGNVTITFTSPIDQIVIAYGNHALSPANPGQQAFIIHDLTFCTPMAVISATKSSNVIADPVNGTEAPKAIPGAVVEYCIQVTNQGPSTATSVVTTDSLPANFTYAPGSMRSGGDCPGASTIEDDDSTGLDDADLVGASLNGGNLVLTASALARSASFAVRFQGTIN